MAQNHDTSAWLGRHQEHHDCLHVRPARFLQATLNRAQTLEPGDAVPPLWHWLYFLEAKPPAELGRDAHPRKGGFLPPVSLPRRMWAGGRFTFHTPLVLGHDAWKRSTIQSVSDKEGRSGRLCFVTLTHEIFQNGALALSEEQDIVYREDPDPAAPATAAVPAPETAQISERIKPSEVLLFRYSALTFNGHRIHYDVDYARDVEGYEGLVFHGPLTATLLVDLAARHMGQTPRRFEFRGHAPIAGMAAFKIEAKRDADDLTLWARRGDGALAMSATARF